MQSFCYFFLLHNLKKTHTAKFSHELMQSSRMLLSQFVTFSHCQLPSKQCYIGGLTFINVAHVFLMPIRRKSKPFTSIYVWRQYSQVAYSRAIECCEQAFTRCMLLPLTTAHDMNILNNCPVGHIPLGKLHVKMAFTDWILCLFYCLWTIMQFDIHQITNNYITNINLPIILVI